VKKAHTRVVFILLLAERFAQLRCVVKRTFGGRIGWVIKEPET